MGNDSNSYIIIINDPKRNHHNAENQKKICEIVIKIGKNNEKNRKTICVYCETEPAGIWCKECQKLYCTTCHPVLHQHPSRKNHTEDKKIIWICKICGEQNIKSENTCKKMSLHQYRKH